jgi:hypothetical protein
MSVPEHTRNDIHIMKINSFKEYLECIGRDGMFSLFESAWHLVIPGFIPKKILDKLFEDEDFFGSTVMCLAKQKYEVFIDENIDNFINLPYVFFNVSGLNILLVPRAVGYASTLLGYAIRSELKAQLEWDDQEKKWELYVYNNAYSEGADETEYDMSGTLELFKLNSDNTLELRATFENISILHNTGISLSADFIFNSSEYTKNYGTYSIVFNGFLGGEEGAVVASIQDLYPWEEHYDSSRFEWQFDDPQSYDIIQDLDKYDSLMEYPYPSTSDAYAIRIGIYGLVECPECDYEDGGDKTFELVINSLKFVEEKQQ